MNKKELLQHIRPAALKDLRVGVVGDLMLDTYAYGRVDRISPEAPVPVIHMEREQWVIGGAGNVAANLIELGAQVNLLSVVGDDEFGNILLTLCRDSRIDVSSTLVVANRVTTQKRRIVAQNQQILRIDSEQHDVIEFNQSMQEKIDAFLVDVDIVCVADYAKGVLGNNLIAYLLNAAKQQNLLVVVDPKPKNLLLYQNVDLLTPNEEEACRATGIEDVFLAGRYLASKTASSVLVTRGAKGMVYFENESSEPFLLESFATDVRDVSGAGDAVTAMVVAMRAKRVSHKSAMLLANYAAAVAVSKPHTAPMCLEDVRRLVEMSS